MRRESKSRKRRPDPSWPACADCAVKGTCEPVPPSSLFTPCDIALVGEAPGKLEHARGKPFVGPSGKLLRGVLKDAGYDVGRCLFDNACRMPHNKKLPIARHCVANTLARIREVKPKMVVALGKIALDALCRKKGGITMWEGVIVQPPRDGRPPIAALRHPAAVLRAPGLLPYWSDLVSNLRKLRHRPEVEFTRVEDRGQFIRLMESLRPGLLAFDYETTGLDPRRERLRSVAFASSRKCFAAPMEVVNGAHVLEALRRPDLKLVAQNAHFEAVWSRKEFGTWPRFHMDTMIAAHLIDENAPKKLSSLTRRWLPELAGYDQAVLEYVKTQKRADAKVYADIPMDELLRYNAGDARATYLLAKRFEREDHPRDLARMLLDASMIFARIQWADNFRVDLDAARKVSAGLEAEYERIVARVRTHRAVRRWEEDSGKEFNVRSPKQVSALLHDKRYLRKAVQAELVPTKSGLPSTSKKALQGVKHPLVKLVQKAREVSQRNATFVKPLPEFAAVDGRMHPVFAVASTVTGQVACSNPNLMNQKDLPSIRGLFRSVEPDGLIVSADYSQLELALLAMFSRDERMIRTYKSGEDFHTMTAVGMFKVDSPTKDQRDKAKRLNYALIFGAGPKNLAGQMGVSEDEAKEFIARWHAVYPGAPRWMKVQHGRLADSGETVSVWGQRRRLPAVWSSQYGEAQEALRQSVNFPIQNADRLLTLWAMIRADAALREAGIANVAANMHDSLVVDLREKRALHDCARVLHRVMVEQAYEELDWMTFPLRIDVSWGRDWSCPHKIDLKKILKKRAAHGVMECGG